MRGSEVKQHLTDSEREAQSVLRDVERELREFVDAEGQCEQRWRAAIGAMAETRIAAAAAGDVLQALGPLDRDIAAIVARRREERAELAELQSEQDAACDVAQREVDAAQATLDAAAAHAARVFEAALAVFRDTPVGRELSKQRAGALEARDRALVAETRAASERAALETTLTHPVHRYLDSRAYGTDAYRARGIARWIDSWAARATQFHEFALRRAVLVGAAEAAEARLDAAQEALRQIKASEEIGAVTEVVNEARDAVDTATGVLESAVAVLAIRQDAAARTLEALEARDAGVDEESIAMRRRVVEALSKANGAVRQAAAADTHTREDDVLLEELAAIEDAMRQLSMQVTQAERERDKAANTLKRARELQSVAKSKGWTRSDSRIRESNVEQLLTGALLAATDIGEVIRRIDRAHTIDEPPRSSMPTTWTSGSSSGGGFGGGSRSTGGGFGGGGRRVTGGSF